MSDWPKTALLPPPDILTPWSNESLGEALTAIQTAAPASGALGATNGAELIPFYLTEARTAYHMSLMNGGTVSGNIDMGIYDWEGNLLVSSGSVAQAGTSIRQEFGIADTVLNPGRYWMAVAQSSNTATAFVYTPGDEIVVPLGGLMVASGTGFTLPNPITMIKASANLPSIPLMCVSFRPTM